MDIIAIINTTLLIVVFLISVLSIIASTKTTIEQNSIKKLLCEKYIDFKPDAKELIDLSNTYWQLDKRVRKMDSVLSEDDKRRINNGLRGIKRYLDHSDIFIEDYEGRRFNSGMNLDVISAEATGDDKKLIIKEVVKPSIFLRGQIIQVSQVIIDKEHKK